MGDPAAGQEPRGPLLARPPDLASLQAGSHPQLLGSYAGPSGWIEIYESGGEVLWRADGTTNGLLAPADDGFGLIGANVAAGRLRQAGLDRVVWDGQTLIREDSPLPDPPGDEMRTFFGHYRRAGDEYRLAGGQIAVGFLLHERRGDLYLQAGWMRLDRIELVAGSLRIGPGSWYPGAELTLERDARGRVSSLWLGDIELIPEPLGGKGETLKIDPLVRVEELRAEALAASPPAEEGPFRAPDRGVLGLRVRVVAFRLP